MTIETFMLAALHYVVALLIVSVIMEIVREDPPVVVLAPIRAVG